MDYYNAAENFEAYYSLASQNKDWTTADGISFHTDACIHLSRIYTTIGERLEQESLEEMLDYLTKAYNTAKESNIIFFMALTYKHLCSLSSKSYKLLVITDRCNTPSQLDLNSCQSSLKKKHSYQ